MSLDALRAHFPHTNHQIYLNHAATSPLSQPVVAAMQAYLGERHGADPEAPVDNFMEVLPVLEATKERIAAVLKTTVDRVAFAPNTSYALNILTQGLRWRSGDRIAIPDGTFPTNAYPFLNLERHGVTVDFIPTDEGAYTVEDVARTITPNTRLVSISWVHFLSGFRADLNAIGQLCADRDVLFCVDAIQGLGAFQMDVDAWNIDFLACGGHKWLMAPQGTGLLYCTEALQAQIDPPAGWLHGPVDWEHLDDYTLTFHDTAERFRLGTTNNVGLLGLNAALDLYLDAGPVQCEARTRTNARRLADGLADLGVSRYGSDDPSHASGIVTMAPDHPEALFEHLKARGITGALRNRKLRLAPAWYTSATEIDTALAAIEAFHDSTPTASPVSPAE